MEEEKASTEALSAGLFIKCRIAAEFLRQWAPAQVRPFVVPPVPAEKVEEREVIFGQLRRGTEWLVTLAKLDSPNDYQAVAAGCRALLEVAVDLVLLTNEPSLTAKMASWERSAKVKNFLAVRAYCERTGADPDPFSERMFRWLDLAQPNVLKERARYGWVDSKGRTYHPRRWTGSGSLLVDAQAADQLEETFQFENFYETRFRELSAQTHGSGQLYREELDSPYFSFLPGQCFSECADLAFLSTRRVMDWLQAWTPSTLAQFSRAVQQATIKGMLHTRRLQGQTTDVEEILREGDAGRDSDPSEGGP